MDAPATASTSSNRVRHDGADALLATLTEESASARATVTADQRLAYLRDLVDPFERLALPAARTVESEPMDGYRRDRVELEVLPGVRFCAYLLVPDDRTGPGPAALAVHGHGYGSRQITGLRPDGESDPQAEAAPGAYAAQLAHRGLVVLVPDVVGFGERLTDADSAYDPEAGNACYRLAFTLLMHGRTVTGLRVAELLGALDHLLGRPEVDPDRIGIIGHSGGALWSMITMALADPVCAGVLVGFPNTFADSFLAVRHCACNILPGVLTLGEQPDLLSLLAPRPLFVESGADDRIFPAAGFHTAVDRVARTYAEAGAAERFEHDLVPRAGHEVVGRRSFDWLTRVLATGPGAEG